MQSTSFDPNTYDGVRYEHLTPDIEIGRAHV